MRRFGALLAGLLLAFGALAPAPAQAPASGRAVIEVLDVGQGDAILIRSPEGKCALIDAGPSRRVVDRLHEAGVESIDLVVVTHHHSDHYGGMDDVIREFRPRYYLATESRATTGLYVKLLQHVKEYGITPIYPKPDAPRTINLGSVRLTVLPQPPEDLQEENDNSIGIRLSYGNLHMLLTGDSEEPARAFWLQNCRDLVADCQILKLAHHGSRNGTDAGWLDVVRPRVAVASLASGNSYGHPHRETLQLLAEYGIPLLRTDQRGTIRIETDGRRTDITGERGSTEMASRRPSRPRDGAAARASNGPRVNLNTASRRELESTLGLSPRTSGTIIRNRPYRSLDELTNLDVLTPEEIARIEPRATVR